MNSIGARLTKYRKENGITQEKLAEIIGVDSKTIGRWERNEYQPSAELLKKIAEAMNVRVSDLIDDHETNQEREKNKGTTLKNKRIQMRGIAVLLFLMTIVISNIIIYTLTKSHYNIHYYEILSYNQDVLISGNIMHNKSMSTIFIDHISYMDKERPRGTTEAIKTNHVVIELLSNSKIVTSQVIDKDENEYLYNILKDVRFYFTVRKDIEDEYNSFDYEKISIRISYGENKVVESELLLKKIES